MAKKRNPLKVDPSRTITLRRMFTAELLKRFNRVRRKIIQLIVEENAFGLTTNLRSENDGRENFEVDEKHNTGAHPLLLNSKPLLSENQKRSEDNEKILGAGLSTNNKHVAGNRIHSNMGINVLPVESLVALNQRFAFKSTAKQVDAFQRWLATQIKVDIVSQQMENKYWEKFVEDGYQKGAGRAFDDTRKASLTTKAGAGVSDFYAGTRAEFLRSSFGRPVAINKVKLLAGRTFSDLKNVTDVMATQIRRELTDGLVRGDNPRVIARKIADRVDKIGKTRAEQIARTEIIRVHAEGQLDAMEALGVEEVGVMVEWSSAGDDRVCPRCIDMDGAVLKVKESHGLIPRHVQCRCAFVPANLGESQKGQKRGKPKIDKSIDDSLKHDIPKGRKIKGVEGRRFKDPKTGKYTVPADKGKRSLAQEKQVSKWEGADVKIDKTRPRGLLDEPLKPTPKPVTPAVKPIPKPLKPISIKPAKIKPVEFKMAKAIPQTIKGINDEVRELIKQKNILKAKIDETSGKDLMPLFKKIDDVVKRQNLLLKNIPTIERNELRKKLKNPLFEERRKKFRDASLKGVEERQKLGKDWSKAFGENLKAQNDFFDLHQELNSGKFFKPAERKAMEKKLVEIEKLADIAGKKVDRVKEQIAKQHIADDRRLGRLLSVKPKDRIKINAKPADFSVSRPDANGEQFVSIVDTKTDEKLKDAVSFLEKLISKSSGAEDIKVLRHRLPKGKRAFHMPHTSGSEKMSGLYLDRKDTLSTYVHELGHRVEDSIKDGRKKAAQFREIRIERSASKDVNLKEKFPKSGYSSDEVGNGDGWKKVFGDDAYYVGKRYTGWGAHSPTEVVSMGVEMLKKDAVKFARDDPEFFDFIIGLLRGEI